MEKHSISGVVYAAPKMSWHKRKY